jgi:hypothetical protein
LIAAANPHTYQISRTLPYCVGRIQSAVAYSC